MFSIIKIWTAEAMGKKEIEEERRLPPDPRPRVTPPKRKPPVIRTETADVRMTTKYGPAVVPPRPRPGRPTPYVIDPGMTTKYGPVVVPPRRPVPVVRPDMTTKYGPVVVPPRTKPGRPDMTTKYGPVVIERIIPINPTTTLYACPVIDMRDDKTKIVPGSVKGKRNGRGGR